MSLPDDAAPAAVAGKRRRVSRRAAVATAALVVLLAAGVIAVVTVAPDKLETSPAVDAPAETEAVLDGTYRFDYDDAQRKVNGALAPLYEPHISMWALTSACVIDGCAATAATLDDAAAGPDGETHVLHFVEPVWQTLPARLSQRVERCRYNGAQMVEGSMTTLVSWTLEPQADETLRGTYSSTVVTAECGAEGEVTQIPFVATRVGDVGDQVALADPESVPGPEPATPRGPETAGPKLVGKYRFDYDGATDWWAFRSTCAESGCVAVGAMLDDNGVATPNTDVLRFVGDRWQQSAPETRRLPCAEGEAVEATVESTWSMQPQPDGTLRGVQTRTYLTDECGTQGARVDFPFVATREGTAAPGVVLADPADFQ